MAIVADAKSFNIADAVAKVEDLISVAQRLTTDCKISDADFSEILITKEGNIGNIASCI